MERIIVNTVLWEVEMGISRDVHIWFDCCGFVFGFFLTFFSDECAMILKAKIVSGFSADCHQDM